MRLFTTLIFSIVLCSICLGQQLQTLKFNIPSKYRSYAALNFQDGLDVICSRAEEWGDTIYLTRFDSVLNKKFSISIPCKDCFFENSYINSENKLFLLLTKRGATSSEVSNQIVRIDSIGNILGAQQLSANDGTNMIRGQAIGIHNDQIYVISRTFGWNINLSIFDEKNQVTLSKTFIFDFSVTLISAKMDAYGNIFIVVDNSKGNSIILKLDKNGAMQWNKELKTVGVHKIYSINVLPNGNLAFSGFISDTKGCMFFGVLDFNGKVLWVKQSCSQANDKFTRYISGNMDEIIVVGSEIPKGLMVSNYSNLGIHQESFELLPLHGKNPVIRESFFNSKGYLFLTGEVFSATDGLSAIMYKTNSKNVDEHACCFAKVDLSSDSPVDFVDTSYSLHTELLNIEILQSEYFSHVFDPKMSKVCDTLSANMEVPMSYDSSCLGECLTLSLTNPTPAVQYTWEYQQNGQNESRTDSLLLLCTPFPTNLRLKADRNGCVNERSIEIPIETVDNIAFPNAFTPDGDSINDVFKPIAKTDCPFVDYHFQVFNRWGKRVFESSTFADGWDGRMSNGRLAPAEVYIWTADFQTEIFGEVVHLQKKGDVTLIR